MMSRGVASSTHVSGTHIVSIVLLSSILSLGCVGRAISPFANLPPSEARALACKFAAAREEALRADMQSAFAGRTPANILVLSGGDAGGAYGCGFLAGWRDSAKNPRPVFDVVTGVSTGALMATATFLGEPRDDQALRDIYTRITDKDVYHRPFSFGPLNAAVDTGPLRQLLARHITVDVFRRVAAAHRAGRRLYVATVGLDQGRLVIWPLSKMAADTCDNDLNAGLERYRRVLLAAASIPLLFPPVEIDGELHVDAGLREGLFLRAQMLGNTAASDPLPAGQGTAAMPTVYVIVNGKLGTKPEAVGDDVVHIGLRSLTMYHDALATFNLREVAHVVLGHQPSFRFKYVAIPDQTEDGPGPGLFGAMFDPAVTRRLYDEGETLAKKSVSPWREGLPPLERLTAEIPGTAAVLP